MAKFKQKPDNYFTPIEIARAIEANVELHSTKNVTIIKAVSNRIKNYSCDSYTPVSMPVPCYSADVATVVALQVIRHLELTLKPAADRDPRLFSEEAVAKATKTINDEQQIKLQQKSLEHSQSIVDTITVGDKEYWSPTKIRDQLRIKLSESGDYKLTKDEGISFTKRIPHALKESKISPHEYCVIKNRDASYFYEASAARDFIKNYVDENKAGKSKPRASEPDLDQDRLGNERSEWRRLDISNFISALVSGSDFSSYDMKNPFASEIKLLEKQGNTYKKVIKSQQIRFVDRENARKLVMKLMKRLRLTPNNSENIASQTLLSAEDIRELSQPHARKQPANPVSFHQDSDDQGGIASDSEIIPEETDQEEPPMPADPGRQARLEAMIKRYQTPPTEHASRIRNTDGGKRSR